MDIDEYPAVELAALYKWRWDGSETALREAKASLDGAGPSAGPMLRSGSPGLVRQELAAWAAGNEMTRGVARAAAARRRPRPEGAPRREARPGPRDLPRPHPPRRDRRDPRREDQLHGADQRTRETPHRHRPEPAPGPQGQVRQHLPPRRTRGHRHPDRPGRHHPREHPSLTSANTGNRPRTPAAGQWNRPSPATTRRPSAYPRPGTTHRHQNREPRIKTQMPKPHGIAPRALQPPMQPPDGKSRGSSS